MLNFTGIFFTLSPDPPLYVVASSFWKLASSNQTYWKPCKVRIHYIPWSKPYIQCSSYTLYVYEKANGTMHKH